MPPLSHREIPMRPSGFEPESLAWKAKVLTRLDYGRVSG